MQRRLLLAAGLLLLLQQAGGAAAESVGYGQEEEEWRGEIQHLSWSPRAFLLKRFLTDEECDYIIKKATPQMTESGVVDNDTGESKKSEVRTSTGTFFSRFDDDVITRIEKRVSAVTMIPIENQEGLQVLHYRDGQKYEPHYDYFHDQLNQRPENGGQRLLTVLMYLSTPEEGGETVFPDADRKVEGPEWSECAREGLANKAVKGDALMFYSLTPDGTMDRASLHGSCPTTKGDKWSATKWIHVSGFGLSAAHQKAKWGDCIDTNDNCKEWAYFGECEKNPAYMNENCRLSCKRCKPKDKAKEEGKEEQKQDAGGGAASGDGAAAAAGGGKSQAKPGKWSLRSRRSAAHLQDSGAVE